MTAVLPDPSRCGGRLIDQFEYGLDAPICLTWELTYACNLACVHCLSSSGRRDPRELSTAEAEAVIDELQRMQVFYVNVGGGEPTVRPDFWHLLDYAIGHDVGVKFSTNGIKLDKTRAAQLARTDYVDVQISLDGATAEVNDRVRGTGSFAMATRALENLAEAGMKDFKVSVVVTRENAGQLDEFKALTDSFGAQLRITRLRPSGRGRRRLGPAAPHAGPAARPLRLAAGQRRQRAHRRLVLPPVGVRRGAARAEPLRRRAGGLPDRPRRRRLRLPVRHPRELPRRQRPRRGRLPAGVAAQRAVRRPAQPADRRRLHQVRPLRRLPRRLHGGQVLHRPAARRPRPRVRAGLRRDGAGRPRPRAEPRREPHRPLAHGPGPRPAHAAGHPVHPARRSSATSRRSPGLDLR